jgi:hypothetical protein
MTATLTNRGLRGVVLFVAASLAGCSRAPYVDLLGSFFPAWLVCFVFAILFTLLIRLALLRLRLQLAFPILVYPSLTALFTLVLWNAFFY